MVINHDLPVKYENQNEPDYEVYLHRIGRAGRFGRKGAYSILGLYLTLVHLLCVFFFIFQCLLSLEKGTFSSRHVVSHIN